MVGADLITPDIRGGVPIVPLERALGVQYRANRGLPRDGAIADLRARQQLQRSARDYGHDLSPDLSPKYMVTVGTRWYLLGLTAAPLYQRVPMSPNSHKHNQDSNSLGGTTKPQVKDLKFPVACIKSGN